MSERFIKTRGARIACLDRGGGATALLFLHYWGGSAHTWSRVVGELGSETRLIAVDHRGWGRSTSLDGRYDIEAMADDVEDVVRALGLKRFVLVGHSMGGKVAQIVAGRRAPGLAGLVLVAPAPPTPMDVSAELRAGMLASYESREGALRALEVLGGAELAPELREQVIEDTLRGEPGAKRSWPEEGMIADLGDVRPATGLPVEVVLAEEDRIEREEVLRPALVERMPQARFTVVPGCGHLVPLAAPGAVSEACARILAEIG